MTNAVTSYFHHSSDHLLAELRYIDLLLSLYTAKARKIFHYDREFQGLFISEEELDQILTSTLSNPLWMLDESHSEEQDSYEYLRSLRADILKKESNSLAQGVDLRLKTLQKRFNLTKHEKSVLLLCVLPEVDLRYEKIFAYLQDDVTKKRPSVDLALNIVSFSFPEKIRNRSIFTTDGRLFKYRLLEAYEDASKENCAFINNYLRVDLPVVNFLLEVDEHDRRLGAYLVKGTDASCLHISSPPEQLMRRVEKLASSPAKDLSNVIINFEGLSSVDLLSIAKVFADRTCRELVAYDLSRVVSTESIDLEAKIWWMGRQARLRNQVICFLPMETDWDLAQPDLKVTFIEALSGCDCPIILSTSFSLDGSARLKEKHIFHELCEPLNASKRKQCWSLLLNDFYQLEVDEQIILDISSFFNFDSSQIQLAAKRINDSLAYQVDDKTLDVKNIIFEACRRQSNQKLNQLTQKVESNYTWDDIILPPDKLRQLKEIVDFYIHREKVFVTWGFGQKMHLGIGLNALFCGNSGTGKTLAANIIACELGLDLYKIDLAMVVSKYIGETEKNLSKIFAEAATSNAILFFDEADAIFGKRTEVKDSHDRYANIETSYLLQKTEDYEGVVILATNLRKNIDDAFVRRMHFTIEFTFPNRKERTQIWQQIWPEKMPRHDDIDLDFLADKLELAGGNIKNIALAASFYAAADNGAVTMSHVMQAARREYQKIGKINMPTM